MIEISRATKEDIPDILRLLRQVLEVHHNGRPDIFKTGATKYTESELEELLMDAKSLFWSQKTTYVCSDMRSAL